MNSARDSRFALGDKNRTSTHLGYILTPIPPNAAPCFAVLKYGKLMPKSQEKGSKTAKKKPPSQHGNGGSIIVFTYRRRWRLCYDSRTK